MFMQHKNLSRHAGTAALFFTFAGVLLSQTPGTDSDSTTSPELIALSTPRSMSNYSVPDAGRDEKSQNLTSLATSPSPNTSSLTNPTKPARVMPGTPADPTLLASKLNTTASVREQSTKRNSLIGVQPGSMPLDVRMDPTASQKYGAAPAMVEIRIGRK
jgi:hypothetical protein